MKKILSIIAIVQFLIVVMFAGMLATQARADTTLNGRWLDYFEEGDSIRKDGGVSVTTSKPKEKAGAYLKTGLWTWNLEKSSLSFKVKVSNWNEAFVITLLVGHGHKFENAATFDIKRRFVGAPNNEWIEVVVPPSAWDIEGTVDWKNIDAVLLSVSDVGNERINVQIADIKTKTMKSPVGIVSFSIDDGLIDTMQAFTIMERMKLRGTVFIDVKEISNEGFISAAQLGDLNAAGWDIGGHNMGILTKYSAEDLSKNLNDTSAYLKERNFQGSNLYALPNGGRNSSIIQELSKNFDFIFNIDGMSNNQNHLAKTNINRHSIDKHTSLALAKKWIDDAMTNNEWVIINFHTFSDTWEKEEDWSIEDFKRLMEYVVNSNIPVMTISEVLLTK